MGGQDVTKMMPRDPDKGGQRTDLRFEYQTRRDEALFERAWFVDFRAAWQRDLRATRDMFQARMEAI